MCGSNHLAAFPRRRLPVQTTCASGSVIPPYLMHARTPWSKALNLDLSEPSNDSGSEILSLVSPTPLTPRLVTEGLVNLLVPAVVDGVEAMLRDPKLSIRLPVGDSGRVGFLPVLMSCGSESR